MVSEPKQQAWQTRDKPLTEARALLDVAQTNVAAQDLTPQPLVIAE